MESATLDRPDVSPSTNVARCTRCSGRLFRQWEDWFCFNCGTIGATYSHGHDAVTELSRKPRPWTEDEIAFVRSHAPVNCSFVGMQMTPPRERSAVRALCRRLDIEVKRKGEVGADGMIRHRWKPAAEGEAMEPVVSSKAAARRKVTPEPPAAKVPADLREPIPESGEAVGGDEITVPPLAVERAPEPVRTAALTASPPRALPPVFHAIADAQLVALLRSLAPVNVHTVAAMLEPKKSAASLTLLCRRHKIPMVSAVRR